MPSGNEEINEFVPNMERLKEAYPKNQRLEVYDQVQEWQEQLELTLEVLSTLEAYLW